MTESIDSSNSWSKAAVAGVLVTQVVAPLWLLAGVVLALSDGAANHLPASIVKWVGATGLDLIFVLYFGAAVELTVIGLLWGLPRVGRLAAIILFIAFIPVLVGDIALGAASCGCFGAVEVPPWFTLTMDLLLLVGVWVLGGRAPSLRLKRELPTFRVVVVGLWVLAAFTFSFALMVQRSGGSEQVGDQNGKHVSVAPPDYYLPEYQQWIDTPWAEVDLARFVSGAPDDLDRGVHYLFFYRKDCEHCHELMEAFFSAAVPAPTTAVAVPEKTGYPTKGVQTFVCNECTNAELPMGCDWFLQTPVLVRLEEGVVRCAAEVSAADPQCILW